MAITLMWATLKDRYRDETVPVGSLPPNALGAP